MSPAYFFNNRNKQVTVMALNKPQKQNEELPFPIEGVEEEKPSISFEDLEFEADYVDDEQTESKKFYTISGKESWYEPTWERYGMQDLEVDTIVEGRPELTIFENEDKSYDALRIRILDDGEIVDLYVNYPKKDYPYVMGINKSFDFYRKCFDFIFSVLRHQGEEYVVDSNGEEINRFKRVHFESFAKYVDSMNRITLKITEGNLDSEYNSFIILKME